MSSRRRSRLFLGFLCAGGLLWLAIPDAWQGALGLLALPVFVLGYCALITTLFGFLFYRASKMPEMVPMPAPPAGEMQELHQRFQSLGFTPAAPPLALETKPPGRVMLFAHRSEPIYGSVGEVIAGSVRTVGVTFFSPLVHERGQLMSTDDVSADIMPSRPGFFCQVLPDHDEGQLLAEHRSAMQLLQARGLRWREIPAAELLSVLRSVWGRRREYFLTAPVRISLVCTWRLLSGRRPHVGPLGQHADLEHHLRHALAAQAAYEETASSPAGSEPPGSSE